MKQQYMTFPNNVVRKRVSAEKYKLAEEVRNYILKKEYEEGQAKWILIGQAMTKYNVTKSFCKEAIYEFRKWYYGVGLCHRPIEDFIARDKKNRENEMLSAQGHNC